MELKLIDGYCIGDLTAQQARAWLAETAEALRDTDEETTKL